MTYFIQGFKLLNKNIEIYIIAAGLWLVSFLDILIPGIPSWVMLILLFALIPIMVYEFSIPAMLTHKQAGKKIAFSYLKSLIWINLKRSILPGLLLVFLLFMILFSLLFVSSIFFENQNFEQLLASWSDSSLNPLSTTHMILNFFFSFIGAFFIFAPIFFSVEKDGLISSFKNSFTLASRNMSFIINIFMLMYIIYFIDSYISSWGNLGPIISSLFYEYTYLILTTSALLYYQKLLKTNS